MTQNQFLARLYMSRLVTVSAIRGACPAGAPQASAAAQAPTQSLRLARALHSSALQIGLRGTGSVGAAQR